MDLHHDLAARHRIVVHLRVEESKTAGGEGGHLVFIKDITHPDPGIVLDLVQAFRCSKALFAAVSLGVFDALANGQKTLTVLAQELKANPDALERLLDACVGLKLLDRESRGYRNTAVASLNSVKPMRWIRERNLWGTIPTCR